MGNQQPNSKGENMGTKITKQQLEERIHKVHPFSKIQIIEYEEKIKGPLVYKCQNCGKIHTLKSAGDIFSKLNPCDCHKEFYSREEKIRYFEKQQDTIEVVCVKGDKTSLYCKNCGFQFERTTVSVMASFDSCPNCNNHFDKQKDSKAKIEQLLVELFPGHHYQVLECNGHKGISKIKCLDCHFVYEGDFVSFKQSRGCPRCHRKQSKGESKIEKWLEDNKVNFIKQKSLDLQSDMRRYKFDFYLPDYSLAIEYNGEQHYFQKKGRFDELSITQKRDVIKKEYCERWGIELFIIPYWECNNIEKILERRLNDYPQGVEASASK